MFRTHRAYRVSPTQAHDLLIADQAHLGAAEAAKEEVDKEAEKATPGQKLGAAIGLGLLVYLVFVWK